MCKNDMSLSLSGETFGTLKKDFDTIMARTIGNMQMKGAEDATITVKLSVSLEKRFVGGFGSGKDITKPTFKHDISSVMQVKDKMTGQLTGEHQLVWDDEEKKYVLRNIDSDQMTMDDIQEEPVGRFVDMESEYEDVDDQDPNIIEAAEPLALPVGDIEESAEDETDEEDTYEEEEYDGESLDVEDDPDYETCDYDDDDSVEE